MKMSKLDIMKAQRIVEGPSDYGTCPCCEQQVKLKTDGTCPVCGEGILVCDNGTWVG